MIDMLEANPVDNAQLATILLAQAGLPVMAGNCECGFCPVGIEEFKIDVYRIVIVADGQRYELKASVPLIL